jgi:DNA polymerase-3 subunit delta
MSEINHSQLDQHLQGNGSDDQPPVGLIHGQEMLVEQALERLVNHLLVAEQRDLCCEMVEGFVENLADALERVNTFALLAGTKIVVFKEAKLFEARSGQQQLLDKIARAFETGDVLQASRLFFSLCHRLEIDPRSAGKGRSGKPELAELIELIGKTGLKQLVQYGLERNWSATEQSDSIRTLNEAINKGFPPRHHLIITTSAKVPKNLKLYKTIRDHGIIVDCHVPLGGRRADKVAQQNVLQHTLETLLAKSGKQLAGGLFDKLCRLTGFDLRTFTQNVEKLIAYTGQRQEITGQDIDHVLRSTKSDPVYEFTNAVADRNGAQALQLMNALLRDKWHPLQILSALANQIRKLLMAKDFAQSESGRIWSSGISYHQFQHQVLPMIQAHDDQIQRRIEQWQASNDAKTLSGVKKSAAEMRIAPNPKNPYPVYQTFVKSERFTHRSLVAALVRLNQADLMLKSSGRDAALVLKSLVLEICGSSS